MTDPATERTQTKPFAQFLQEIQRGRVHADLSDELADVIGAVMRHGKKGTLSLKLDIKPEGDEAISVGVTYSAKPPQPPMKPVIFFADEQGHVSRQRLNQPELPLREVAGGQDTSTQDGGAEAAQA